jgi:hypothetical protein
MGFKTTGERCQRPDNGNINLHAAHLSFCNIHWGVYDGRVGDRMHLTVVIADQHHHAGTCHHWIGHTRWCGQICPPDSLLCITHAANARVREERRAAERQAQQDEADRINTLLEWYRANPMTWRQVMDHVFVTYTAATRAVKYRVCRTMFLNPGVIEPDFLHDWQFQEYWAWCVRGRIGHAPDLVARPVQLVPPPRPAGLAALARDGQNVHTRVVVEQTNKGLEKLLQASSTGRQMRSPEWFAAKWLVRSYGNWNLVVRVVNDMQHWYGQAHCKEQNDWLYRKTLDGLYVTVQQIKDTETRTELYKRVFEECYESVAMCCEGHISRMCNVLVGFDETFAPPVPFGEILQNKMSAIAAMEIETEEKVKQATAFFNEFAVPETERAAWLEAF